MTEFNGDPEKQSGIGGTSPPNPFEELERGERYQSVTTTEQEVLEVVAVRSDDFVYAMLDEPGNPVDTFAKERWEAQTQRWKFIGMGS